MDGGAEVARLISRSIMSEGGTRTQSSTSYNLPADKRNNGISFFTGSKFGKARHSNDFEKTKATDNKLSRTGDSPLISGFKNPSINN